VLPLECRRRDGDTARLAGNRTQLRIDSHLHLWRYDPAEYAWIDDSMAALRRDFLPADAWRVMESSGVDGCLVVQARQTLQETRWLLDLADRHPFISGVVGWVDLTADDVAAQLDQFSERRKLVGIRHIVQSEPDDRFMLRPDFCRGIALLEDLNLTYDILIYPRHLSAATELVSRFPRVRFILDHLAKPPIRSHAMEEWEAGMKSLSALPNVFAKLSGLVTEADWMSWTVDEIRPYLEVAFACFGANRLLAGSDWPVCTLAADYGQAIAMIDEYAGARSPAERQDVMGDTALRLWGRHSGEFA
jgi:L-fuconolactonase